MKSGAVKSLVICAMGVAVIAGCASSSPSQKMASLPSNVQSGKVTAVETVAVVDQTATGSSSGSGAIVTTSASSGPSGITVQFNDGSEHKYVIERPVGTHAVGEPVYVITDGDRTTILAQ